jgi:hypothetical protein
LGVRDTNDTGAAEVAVKVSRLENDVSNLKKAVLSILQAFHIRNTDVVRANELIAQSSERIRELEHALLQARSLLASLPKVPGIDDR